jgi:hypothetical protein
MTMAASVANLLFPKLEFMRALQAQLNESARFRECTAWWDGAVLLKAGGQSAWMKWYKGQVIDVQEGPSPLGFTFALTGSADSWTELIQADLTSYRSWARLFASGGLVPEGNIFEYRRMSEAVYTLCYHIRRLGSGRDELGVR